MLILSILILLIGIALVATNLNFLKDINSLRDELDCVKYYLERRVDAIHDINKDIRINLHTLGKQVFALSKLHENSLSEDWTETTTSKKKSTKK